MTTEAVVRTGLPAERTFYLAMTGVIFASVLLGFARTFFLRLLFPQFALAHAPHEAWFYVHGVVFSIWLVIFATQVSLVANRRTVAHRKLGVAGFVLVPVIAVLTGVGGLIAAHRPGGFIDVPTPPLQFLIDPESSVVVFAILAGLGLALRRQPQTHKRLMLLATITLTEPAIARWPVDFVSSGAETPFWMMCVYLVPLVVWDLASRRSLHPATLWGGLLILAEGALRLALAQSTLWLGFAKWAVSLVG